MVWGCEESPNLHSRMEVCNRPMDPVGTPPKINGWNPKMEIWKMIFLFNGVIFRFHDNFHGCMFRETDD